MFRSLAFAVKNIQALGNLIPKPIHVVTKATTLTSSESIFQQVTRNYSINALGGSIKPLSLIGPSSQPLLQPQSVLKEAVRTNIKFSRGKGTRKTVKVVLSKFYRLNWGCWIRGMCGRQKRLYKKSAARRRRLQYHVFTNARQSWLLDKMVTRYWRRPRHYVDDPYEPYHSREEYPFTRQKPFQPFL